MAVTVKMKDSINFAALQWRGTLRQRWLEGVPAGRKCPIEKSTLKLADLIKQGFLNTDEGLIYYDTGDLDETIEEHMMLPKPSEWARTYRVLLDPNVKNAQDEKDLQLQLWEGHIAPGILYIDTMYRRPGTGPEAGPPSSQIAQAAYEAKYPIDTLKHIILCDVVHKPTKKFIKHQLYTEKNGLSWPDEKLVEWKYNTPEYKAIIGTKIGNVVAYIVLGGFPRGTPRISSIWTCSHHCTLFMRFDIERIEPVKTAPLRQPRAVKTKRRNEFSDSDSENFRQLKRQKSF
ncbi:uncharacterized protein N7483_012834 [Penicillium malachiteum]|uniref:uncharacterized protein n=1 Tax=Penicillium malachiteum TaxID=1324776 RepID=UPI00254787AC|nr:uncharacterized protein N7483_012834 [Penicillium malachiteum]KAJ5715653.1 hypothetical protein N7483_012834 [Penicillium malachiteum]